jgi:hypothetical protein
LETSKQLPWPGWAGRNAGIANRNVSSLLFRHGRICGRRRLIACTKPSEYSKEVQL